MPHVAEPEYDPVWAGCADLEGPLCLHAGASPTLQYAPHSGLTPTLAEALNSVTKPVSSVFVLGLYLFSRILMRHPRLRVYIMHAGFPMLDDLLAVLVGGISPSSLRRYSAGERETPDEVAWRLHALARIVAALRGSYNAYGIRRWFERRRSQLGERTPGQVLVDAESEDDAQEVVRLAEALLGPGMAT